MIPAQKSISTSQGIRVPHPKAPLTPDCDILTRTSWADASIALAQINKGKASGNKEALWLRTWLQKRLFLLGCFIQRNPGKIIFVGLLVLSCFCVGLKSATIETNVEKLWIKEGGRLEKELGYVKKTLGEGVGSTNQILIHTPKEIGANVLNRETLMTHLHVLKAAIQISVEVYNIPWSLKDICYSPSFPFFEKHYIDMPLENLFPCAIITPLDCFWEGSKLLGPEFPVKIPGLNLLVQWSNLNPQLLIDTMKKFGNYVTSFPLHTIESFMKRAGITTAYQKKPCLHPSDKLCPDTAPNKKNIQFLDVGAELTGGCYGFATKYMHWPEDVLVGGVTKNKTGHIVRAEALQTIIQLMAEKEMYEFWHDHIKVHNLDWTVEKAKKVLEEWQRKFTEVVLKESETPNITKRNIINVFSTTSLGDMMKDFSEISVTRVAGGYIAMLIYTFFCLMKCYDPVHSQSGIGIIGVVLVALSVAAGLGFCAILGIVFNAATTQVLPFLALGLGMDDMFLVVHQYSQCASNDYDEQEQLTGECLKRTGVNITLTSFSNMCAFLAAVIIPIPALRTFALQAAMLVVFNASTILLIFPAVISIDIKRQKAKRVDILCCLRWKNKNISEHDEQIEMTHSKTNFHPSVVIPIRQAVTHALPPDGRHVVTVLAQPSANQPTNRATSSPAPIAKNVTNKNLSAKKLISKDIESREHKVNITSKRSNIFHSPSAWFVTYQLIPTLKRPLVKFLAIVMCLALICFGVWGICHVKDGLDLTDIVPRDTNEYKFLYQRSKYFGFFNMFAVTQGNFEYPTNQQLLYDYHDAFTRIDKIIKNDDGGLPDFWLTMFKDWLSGLQKAFDTQLENACITEEGWCSNATDDSIMAYKLLVQTGRIDNPVDKSLVKTVRLVDSNGIINTKAFYNYLSAWVSNDALAYSASQANFVPEPRRWVHDPQDVELKMPKSQPLVYAQIPFFLNKMGTTEEITDTIRAVRAVCEKYEEKGLPNFPVGLPFIYWEQYIGLRYYLLLALLCIFAVIFLVIATVLFNPWAAFVVIFLLAVIVVELFGFMGILGIKLSAVPAVILIAAVGVGVEFAAHIMMGFLTSIGNRERRMAMTLEQMFCPVAHGAFSTLLGVIMLAFSEFDFIFRYFFSVLCALIILGLLNGFVLFPVILSIIGPPGEVIPHEDPERIPTPSPEPSPISSRIRHARPFNKKVYPRMVSEISLSTITEESSSSHSSHEIILQPEVVVETTTITNTSNGSTTINTTTSSQESGDSQSEDSVKFNLPKGENISTTTTTSTTLSSQPSASSHTAVTTRVTATAKVKVEVHAPISVNKDSSRYRRRRDSSSSRSSSNRSSPI